MPLSPVNVRDEINVMEEKIDFLEPKKKAKNLVGTDNQRIAGTFPHLVT